MQSKLVIEETIDNLYGRIDRLSNKLEQEAREGGSQFHRERLVGQIMEARTTIEALRWVLQDGSRDDSLIAMYSAAVTS